jgi:aminoglycoside 6'-N-acetyltransferase
VKSTLRGTMVSLRPATADDVPVLAAIRATPEVFRWWRGGDDMTSEVAAEIADSDAETLVGELDGRVAGAIQWSAETEPDYRHASIDIYLDPAVHGRGVGTDAVRTLARHLIIDAGFHRLVIDPAADNAAAIKCYSKVGFRPVGIMRMYERGSDGSWHDGLLMNLLAEELPGERGSCVRRRSRGREPLPCILD